MAGILAPVIDRDLLRDEDLRAEMAEQSYYRERQEEAAVEREHEVDEDLAYYVIAWEDLSPHAQRPYRTAVATVCDSLEQVLEAA